MVTNERTIDRIARAAVGAILLAIFFYSLNGPTALVEGIVLLLSLGFVGAFLLLTGLIGWCPAYALFGFSTRSPQNRTKRDDFTQ
jgi:hypothetical protein